MKMNEPVACDNAELAWAFPSVDPGAQPLGGRILVQLRRTHKKATSRRDEGNRKVEQHGSGGGCARPIGL
jgi:hypothetical protein